MAQAEAAEAIRDARTPLAGLAPFLIALVLGCLVMVQHLRTFSDPALILDPDSAMRLVQVRDLLAGQGWFDLTQHRLGTGTGVEMHWSRLVDAGQAGVLLVAGLLTDRATSEWVLLILWPTIWLVAIIWTCLDLSRRMGGPTGMAVASFGSYMLLSSLSPFLPGQLDHHNMQIAMLLVALWGVVARHDVAGAPIAAGLAVSASLVIGTELLPVMMAFCCVQALTWAIGGEAERRAAIRFGTALVVGLLVQFALMSPASAYAGGYCDALSMDLLLPVVGAASVLVLAALRLSGAAPRVRLGVLALGLLAVGAGTAAFLPACLANPLDQLDPLLAEHWLSHIREARSLSEVLRDDPARIHYVALVALGAGAVLALGWLAWQGRSPAGPLAMIVVLGVLAALTVYQIRYLNFFVILSIPAWAPVAAELRRRSIETGRALYAVAAVAVVVLSTPQPLTRVLSVVAPGLADNGGEPATQRRSVLDCFSREEFASLSSVPPGRVAATANLGPYILLWSDHEVLSAPFHRNQAGMAAELRVELAQDPEEAARLLRAEGVDYLILCSEDPELHIPEKGRNGGPPLLVRVLQGEVAIPGFPVLRTEGDFLIYGPALDAPG